jgi:hypothetical protein
MGGFWNKLFDLETLSYMNFEFVILCSWFKNTIFEEIYNTVNARYKIGRFRLMES